MIQIMRKYAFSIVELLVVIAIIGIISAVAIPSYKKYIMQTNFMEAVNILQECRKQIDVGYQETGTFPNDACGATLNNSDSAFTSKVITKIHYGSGTLGNQLPSAGVWIYAFMSVNIVPEVSQNDYYGTIHIAGIVSPSQNKLIWYCGIFDTTGYLPSTYLKYLPAECNSSSVFQLLQNIT